MPERSINQQGFTRAATCTFISLPLALSGRSRWLVAEKDHDQAWTLIAQHQRTNTRWATVFRGRKIFLGISLSMIMRGVLSLACCASSTIQSSIGTWTDKRCNLLRRDIIQCHKDSKMHKEAEELEAARLASQKDGGIRQAFSSRIMIQRKALIGALKLMYWLAKEEVAQLLSLLH